MLAVSCLGCYIIQGIVSSQSRHLDIKDTSTESDPIVVPLTRDRKGKLEVWAAVQKVAHVKHREKRIEDTFLEESSRQ